MVKPHARRADDFEAREIILFHTRNGVSFSRVSW
jgi:hypothetical protein